MAKEELRKLLFSKASRLAQVDAVLLSAIVEVESGWRAGAMRFEPAYVYLYRPEEMALKNGIDLPTERCLQRFSFGLGQLMGATARELGFDNSLPDLLEPSLNLDYMIKYFQKHCDEYVYAEDKIAAYNAGSVKKTKSGIYVNQGYVNKVLKVLSQDSAWSATKTAPHGS